MSFHLALPLSTNASMTEFICPSTVKNSPVSKSHDTPASPPHSKYSMPQTIPNSEFRFQISVLEDIKVVTPTPLPFLLSLSLKSLLPTLSSMGGMQEPRREIWGVLNHLEIALPPRPFWAFPLESDNRQPTSVLKHWVVAKCELPTV